MKNLLYKEFRLAAHPTVYIFLLFSAMILIPSYPYFVSFFYTTLGIFFTFINGRENNDVFYTALLPVAKKDVVKARCVFIALIELFEILLCIPFAIISVSINPNGSNLAGMEPNVAFFGLAFVLFAIFNIILIPGFYKTAYKVGKPFIIASTAVFIFIAACEVVSHLSKFFDSLEPKVMITQIPILAFGFVFFVLMTLLSYRFGARRFEKVNL